MKKLSYLENETSYTASLTDTEIYKPKNLRRLWLSFQGDMTAGSAKTVANLLAAIDPFEIKVAATPRIRLTGAELQAFNELYLGNHGTWQKPGATTDDKVRCVGMQIPMNYPTTAPPIHYSSSYTAASGIDTMKITLTAEYQDAALTEGPLQALKTSYTASASGSLMKAHEEVLNGDLLGVLLYVTTAPQDDSDNCGIAELEMEINGDKEIQVRWWDLYRQKNFVNDIDGTATVQMWDNWGLLDLREDPIPAGAAIRINTLDDVAEAVKIIPIERLSV